MRSIMLYFLLFMIYSMIGWIFEMIFTIIVDKKLINRGFLIGPYLPIYGTNALCVIILLKPYRDDYLVLFVMSVIVSSIVEYLTSYLMEKIFKARWWDYTHMPFNINGRICLLYSLGFGVAGALTVILNKYVYSFLNQINFYILLFAAIISFTIFIIDEIVSFNIINKIKLSDDNLKKDYSEEISEKVKNALSNNSILNNRLLKAFPNIEMYKKK